MSKRLLVICGPTATGKTTLAVKIAKSLNGEIVSADSRQVYRNMDIGTGKDIPRGARFRRINKKIGGYYTFDGVRIWGYDLVSPKESFSVADYVPIAREIIERIWGEERLSIVVGGTGLYIQGVVDGIKTASVPKNESLRKRLEGRGVEELFEQLAQLDPIKAASLNSSDKKNPRRLVRAIEIAQWEVGGKKKKRKKGTKPLDEDVEVLFVGLKGSRRRLCKRIEKRVEKRIRQGIKKEIEKLLASGVTWDDQTMDSLGYRQWERFFEGKKKQKDVVKKWKKDECQYAKRQMTWFKKDKRIDWFDIFSRKYPENVEKTVKKWYKEN
jgi:tRNA dimethylallyltransferase